MNEQNEATQPAATTQLVDINQVKSEPGSGMASLEKFFNKAPEAAPVIAPAPEPAKTEAPGTAPSLAEVIREQRLAREARTKAEADAKASGERAKAVEAENAKLRGAVKFEDDPLQYAEVAKMTQEQRLRYGEALIYSVAVDKAPPELRWKLEDVKRQRREAAESEAKAKQEAEARAAAEYQQVESFYRTAVDHSRTVAPEAFPESADWFGEDHDARARSMIATARNMADTAAKYGRMADLSVSSVAAELERETARRLGERDTRRAARQPKKAEPVVQSQSAGNTMSTRGLGAGAPLPPATTTEERVRRAAKAGWGS